LACSYSSEEDDPLLWASTYEAGAHLMQRQQPPPLPQQTQHAALKPAAMDPRKAAVRGYKAQAGRVLEHVDRLLAGCEARRQSVVVEGVHLSLRWVVG
jgi:2-phosphoglycerate kinase